MFKRQIEAVLKTVNTSAKGEWRFAQCLFHVPLDRQLAKEVGPRVADRLYRLKNPTASNSEFVPCLEIRQLKFSASDVKFDTMQMEFRTFPDKPLAGARIPGVEMKSVQAVRLKGADDLTLALSLKFKFMVTQAPMVSKLIIEQLSQSVWLTFTEQQTNFLTDEEDAGLTINEKAKAAREK